MKILLPIIGLLFIAQSCIIQKPEKIIVENDIVNSTKRVKRDFHYNKACEEKSPFIKMDQTLFKEINDSGNAVYYVFDNISLRYDSYGLEERVYIILDEKTVLPMDIINFNREFRTHISEDNKKILTADSTYTNIVTGYSHYNWLNYKIHYLLEDEDILKIIDSENVYFRYYAGPDMITVKLTGYRLQKFKKLIHTT